MALTGTQRASVRLYLGWPARFLQSSPLEQAMDAVANQPDDEANIVALLPQVAAVDEKLTATITTCLRIARADSVEFKADNGIGLLVRQGRRLVGRISSILAVPIDRDYFGPARTSGNYMLEG